MEHESAAIEGDTHKLSPPACEIKQPFIPQALNYTDWHALTEHATQLPPRIGGLLESIDYRIDQWPQRFARECHQYRANASLLAMSEFDKADLHCRCCTIGSTKGKFNHGRCELWKICPYCSHRKRKVILRKFLPKFRQGCWWFLTISPMQLCPVNMLTEDLLVAWWEACRFALYKLKEAGHIKGAFTLETIFIHSYWPNATGQPHVHVVILADTITTVIIDELKRILDGYRGQWWHSKKRKWIEPAVSEPLWAKASTRTYAIRRDYDFASVLSYMCNPINFAAAYIQDWPQVAESIRDKREFNENVNAAINAWCGALRERWGHRYLGALQHAHKSFAGVKKEVRDKPQSKRLVKTMLEECKLKRLILFDPEDMGTPVEFDVPEP